MTASRRRPSREQGATLRAAPQAHYVFAKTEEFDEALRELDGPMWARLPALLIQRFQRPWLDGMTETELARTKMNFKQLHGTDARAVGLRQLTFLNDFRVHLIMPEGANPPAIYYVHVYRKTRSDESAEIARAIAAARKQLGRLGWKP